MKIFGNILVIFLIIAFIWGAIWLTNEVDRRDREFYAACPFKQGSVVKHRIDGRKGIVVSVNRVGICVKYPTPNSEYPYGCDCCQPNEIELEK